MSVLNQNQQQQQFLPDLPQPKDHSEKVRKGLQSQQNQQKSKKWVHMMSPFDKLTKEQLDEMKEKIKDLGLDISKRLS